MGGKDCKDVKIRWLPDISLSLFIDQLSTFYKIFTYRTDINVKMILFSHYVL